MPLPKRSAPYIMTILLLVLLALVVWMNKALNAPELRSRLKKTPPAPPAESTPSAAPPLPAPPGVSDAIDPAHIERAAQLHSPDITPEEDLEIVQEFVGIYRKAYGANPSGINSDITGALTGAANSAQPGRLFPADSQAIRNGELVDRWGTPYWFHPVTSASMEIRSAGPDKELFTADDIVLNDTGVTEPR